MNALAFLLLVALCAPLVWRVGWALFSDDSRDWLTADRWSAARGALKGCNERVNGGGRG